ncbi:glycoside hydrolase family 130 protein [Roseivirga sp. UBA1976]|uniref:glycoside hydrolase family 130 protein n=1 Tax=Roseivirga sp. UBA1976 TaxID=1947386 RepID=UPI00257BEDDC|nr:glycoside hydrolase family 130 protein [Roseivirga sp. UBA1976]MEC7754971.1 glycoside hydrolase family 130 protein [Bacteroidota bacterium]
MKKIAILLFVALLSCEPKEPWLTGFEKPEMNPILKADSTYTFLDPLTNSPVAWQKADVFNPAAVVKDDTVFMFFRAEDNPKAYLGGRTSRIGLAWSTDGLNFNKFDSPVLYPDSTAFIAYDYPGGCEDPRVVKAPDGRYIMTYTSWNQDVARLSIASSKDLRNWTKHGPALLNALQGKFVDTWSKSGSIVCKQQGNELIATKINGKYWMYFGERGVNLAWSEDLINWTPLTDGNQLAIVMDTRPGYFDSFLTEPGPPALLTSEGILLIYNGKNDEGDIADPDIAKGTYCGGQALFSAADPSKFIKRMDEPFICPTLPHEITGQYAAGTTFLEALVPYKDRWFMYYGTADSFVGVAVANQ